jgi:hypothetical protein
MTQQIHEEELRGLFDTADDDHRLAKVGLGRTGRMRQRHGDFAPAGFALAHTILHDRAATGEVVLGPGPLEHPLRRMALLAMNLAITPPASRRSSR